MSRNQQLALTAIANQFAMEMFDAQVDADAQKSMGALLGNVMQTVFNSVINATGDQGSNPGSEGMFGGSDSPW